MLPAVFGVIAVFWPLAARPPLRLTVPSLTSERVPYHAVKQGASQTSSVLGVRFFYRPGRSSLRRTASPLMSEQAPRDTAQQEAYEAGVAAADESVKASSPASRQKAEGKAFTILLRSKPLGLLLEENPSGRGVSVSAVIEGAAAAKRGGIAVGDYLVGLSANGKNADFTWLGLLAVQELVEQAKAPVELRLRRGGPEPWTTQRDRTGLSVDDMVDETRREFGTLLDDE